VANLISFVILCFLLWGRTLYRSNLRLHIFIMSGVILADLMLILALVFVRDALSKVDAGMPWTLKVHVPIAIGTVLLYIPTAWTGYQLWRGRPLHARMRTLDRWVVSGRVLTLITSLMVEFLHV
jgi:hypothetical protein